jgi:hypothetical protein
VGPAKAKRVRKSKKRQSQTEVGESDGGTEGESAEITKGEPKPLYTTFTEWAIVDPPDPFRSSDPPYTKANMYVALAACKARRATTARNDLFPWSAALWQNVEGMQFCVGDDDKTMGPEMMVPRLPLHHPVHHTKDGILPPKRRDFAAQRHWFSTPAKWATFAGAYAGPQVNWST